MNDKTKIMMNRAMHYMMLSCGTATFLLTKREYQKLGCKERMQLRMHLMGCKFCRAFNKQNAVLSKQLVRIIDVPPAMSLSDEKKLEIEGLLAANK